MAEILASIGTVFTSVIGWAGTVATTVSETPLLLMTCVGIPLCGIGVGMFGRLIHSRV